MKLSPTFSEADLDRLEALLDSSIFKDESMQLDELQALLCAVASGPETIPPSVWLPAALGETPAYETESQESEAHALVMGFYKAIAMTLSENDELELILYPFADDPDELDFATWADAYIFGTQLGCDWYAAAGEQVEDLSELLQSFFLLNGMLKEDAENHRERWMSAAEEMAAVSRAQEELPELVVEIYQFWREQRSAAETGASGMASDTVCPCGSGKPFKKCCGSPGRLH
ncbi:MAG: UPF0149 family protein [Sterolibacterium sp.]